MIALRVLVTGASGFLGGTLCRFLRDRGYDVVGTGRSARRCALLVEQGFEVHQADLSAGPVQGRLGNPDAIVHTAALSAPWGAPVAFQAANIDTTRNIITAARRLGVARLVNISSPSVYFAPKDQLNVDEGRPLPKPFNDYARTKAEAECLALSTPEIGPISLRPRGIYGFGDTTLLPRLLQAARAHPLPIFREGRAKIDLTHVSDVCAAIEATLRAGSEAEGQTFNISGGEVLPISQIIDMTCARAGITPRWRAIPFRPAFAAAKLSERITALLPSAGEPRITAYALALLAFEQSLNIDKAAQVLEWSPQIRFEDGLQEALRGERDS